MVLIPKRADSHIQKIAPIPPMAIAVATPPMFPVPTCAATAVASAWKELILLSCFSSFFLKIGPKAYLKAKAKCLICGNPR